MQLARLRYHLPTRTFRGKFVQIVRALELERHYSKSQILEAYLNLAPYGRNIEGIGAASQIYFGKSAGQFFARSFSASAQTERTFLAPHFVQQVVAAEKGRDEIVTTLDLAKQQLIERRITDYVRVNRGRGIQNAAALLIDTRSMDVLAQVG